MAKYDIEINNEDCTGDKLCCEEAPHTFDFDENDRVFVADVDGDPDDLILRAAQACPLDAIVLRDARTGRQIWPEVS